MTIEHEHLTFVTSFPVFRFSIIIAAMGAAKNTLIWINRKWIFALKDGTAAIDWGDGMAQMLLSGDFLCYTADEFSHLLRDDEMPPLIEAGRVATFNEKQAAIHPWPPH